jgi:hypothetical protein
MEPRSTHRGERKNSWSHRRVAAAAVFVLLAGAWTTADDVAWIAPELLKQYTLESTKCKHYVCAQTCEESTYTGGYCLDAKRVVEAVSIECCCCTEGSKYRVFLGG